jgi:transcriptional regulator GlxA family with amidase domain
MAKTVKARARAIDVAVFVYEGCSAWITAGLIEMFAIANVAIRGTTPTNGRGPVEFRCHAISRTSRSVRGSHGVRFSVERPRRRYDAIVVPPLWGTSRRDVIARLNRLGPEYEMLQRLSRRASIMAGTCTGTVLLAKAGLLSRRRATTCWWMIDWFRREFPDVALAGDKLVVTDGDRWTAAAGAAYVHLGLQLVGKFSGEKAAAATARLMLVERRRGSQSPFIEASLANRDAADADVARMVQFLERNAGAALTIDDACRRVDVNARSMTRKFQASLGMSPLAYLQSVRIARAKRLLEQTAVSFDEIVGQCGYEDASSFRKLFARHVGMTPREFRTRFGSARSRP